MFAARIGMLLSICLVVDSLWGQSRSNVSAPTAASNESISTASPLTEGKGAVRTAAAVGDDVPVRGELTNPRRFSAQVSRGTGVLPNEHGQIWREYDIRPYTSQVTNTERPQQAIIDWILRETGTEIWFSEPLGILSADRDTVRVYHVPQVQNIVGGVIDRFLRHAGETNVFGLRLVTVGSPNWRARMLQLLRPVTVQTPGTEAWLLSKEDAALLLSEMRKRNDYREHNAPNLLLQNGQQETITRIQPQKYVKSINLHQDILAGYQLESGEVPNGFTLQLTPLLSLDANTVDAVIKAEVTQVEKLEPISIEVPSPTNVPQRVEIQIPRMSGWRLHERFRWPVDKVLLVSRGVVATPSAGTPTGFSLRNPLSTTPARADALLFLESKGQANSTGTPASGALPAAGLPNVRRFQ